MPYTDSEGRPRHMVPDFYLPSINTYVEYFGFYTRGYKIRAAEKRRLYTRLGIKCIDSDDEENLKEKIASAIKDKPLKIL